MNQVTFKRHGFTDLLYLDAGNVYVEYHHLSGSILINVRNGRSWELAFWGKTEYKGENPLEAVPEIEALIKKHTATIVSINADYVEAYMITSRKPLYAFLDHDKQFFKGICIDGLTFQEVREKANLDIEKDFGHYKIEKIYDLLEANTEKLKNMLFSEFVTMLHDHHYKKNFRAVVQARVI